MRWLISVPFCSFPSSILLFFIQQTGIGLLLYMQRRTLLKSNWFHFLGFCNGLLLNISLYWYIKSEWKLPFFLSSFVVQNIKNHTFISDILLIEDLFVSSKIFKVRLYRWRFGKLEEKGWHWVSFRFLLSHSETELLNSLLKLSSYIKCQRSSLVVAKRESSGHQVQ